MLNLWDSGMRRACRNLKFQAVSSGMSTDGVEASGGQRAAFKRRFIFHTPARWMCFVLTASQISLRIFDFWVRLGGESGAGLVSWRGGSAVCWWWSNNRARRKDACFLTSEMVPSPHLPLCCVQAHPSDGPDDTSEALTDGCRQGEANISLSQTVRHFYRPYHAALPVLLAPRVHTGNLSAHFSPSRTAVFLWAEWVSRFWAVAWIERTWSI